MIAGEKEQRLAFEKVTTVNVQAAVSFSNETRNIVRELEERVQSLQNIIMNRDNDIKLIKQQLAIIYQ